MDFSEVTYEEGVPFEGYGPGFFRLGGEVLEGSLVVHAGGARRWQGYADAEAILALGEAIDFVLIGTGADMTPVPADLRAALEGAGIGVELMSTGSACRTYNVLLGEGRRMAAAVLAL